MEKYQGINPNDLMILSYVRFNNSKQFYESQKDDIKSKIIIPMQILASELAPFFEKLDEHIVTNPKKMLSRVRRDTRFTKDKTLYRESMWINFMRSKAQWSIAPVVWFEVSANEYSYGIGFRNNTPAFMQCYRNYILENQPKFKLATDEILKAGFNLFGDCYKKEKDGEVAEKLRKYYQMKDIYFIKSNKNLNDITSNELVEILLNDYKKVIKIYDCFAQIVDKFVSED